MINLIKDKLKEKAASLLSKDATSLTEGEVNFLYTIKNDLEIEEFEDLRRREMIKCFRSDFAREIRG